MKKRLLGILFVLVMALTLLPMAATADGLYWSAPCETCNNERSECTATYEYGDGTQHHVVLTCKTCGKVASSFSEKHSGTGTATCTTGITCDLCGGKFGVLGHDWKWTSNGDGTHTRTCGREGCSANETANCSGGEATCIAKAVCKDCGAGYGDIDANHHTGGTATCSAKAVCTDCKQQYGDIDPNNHTGGTEVKDAKDATCTEKGYTGDTYCKGCGVKLADGTDIPALDHNWDTTYTWTQTGNGYTCTAKRVCKNNPEHVETETATAAYAVDTEPTCLTAGVGRYQASFEADWAEGASKDVSIPALSHDWGEWKSNGDGTHTHVCKRDDTHSETVSCSGGTATCTEKATCADCGETYGEKDSTNHTGKKEWTTTKTKHEQKWSCCGEVVVAEESHTFGDWVVTKQATSKQSGEKTHTCEVCDYTETAKIPATGGLLSPKTGDDSHIGMWAGILCVSLAGIIVLVVLYRKKHKK